MAIAGPAWALGIDATTYLLPIGSVMFLLQPRRDLEQRSDGKAGATLLKAWRDCGGTLRGVLTLTAGLCVVNFFHPGLAPLIAEQVLGPDPRDLGLFTSVLAAGSIAGGVVLQRNSARLSSRPFLTLGGFALITAIAQLGMASTSSVGISLGMTFLIGAGTAGLLSSCNLITQIGAPGDARTHGRAEPDRLPRRWRSERPAGSAAGDGHKPVEHLRHHRGHRCRIGVALDCSTR